MRISAQIFLLVVLILSFAVFTLAQEKLWKELHSRFDTLYQRGRYGEAAKVVEEVLKVAENTFGPDHPNVALSLNNLALVYQAQGRYAEAESHYK